MKMTRKLLQILLCIWILTLNGDLLCMSFLTSWDWFEAQQHCSNNNDTLRRGDSFTKAMEFWSSAYQRQSSWIKILGCYYLKNGNNYQGFQMIYPSVGFCQEICESVNTTVFGLKEEECVCLERPILARKIKSNRCNATCKEDNGDVRFLECGGPNAYSLYIADIIKDTSISPNSSNTKSDRKTTCLTLSCGAVKAFSISSDCSELYRGICEDKGYLGCYEDQNPRTLDEGDKWYTYLTVEKCKEFCSARKTKFYGVEFSYQCFCGNCLSKSEIKPDSECSYLCSGDSRQICGGQWRISTYRNPDAESKQNWTESMKWCKSWPLSTYLSGNISLIDATMACQSLDRTNNDFSWVGVAKEVYIGNDRGVLFDANQRRTFLQCQKCNRTDCVFIDCYNKLTNIHCEKTSLVETIIDNDTSIANPKELGTLITIISSLLVFFIVACCSVMVVTWYIWKKKRKNKENENNVQRSNPTENCYANVNGDHAIIEYNSKQKPLSKHLITQENPVKNLDESYWETLDGVYDHLGDKETKQNKNDNVYDHAHFAAEPEDGVYDIGNRVKSKDKFQEEEATYDHAGSYSDYGQHGEQVDKMEDTYSRLYIKSRSGH